MNEEKRKNFRENTGFSTRFRTIRAVLFDDDNYKFAEAVEIHYTNLSKIINGTANPSRRVVANLLDKCPELNPDWVLNGKGTMLRSSINIESNSGNVAGVNNGTQTANANFADVVASQQRTIEQLTATNAKLTDLLASR